jgi:hypothetical protein
MRGGGCRLVAKACGGGGEEDIKVAAGRCGVDASSEPICKALEMSCAAASAFKERSRAAVDVLNQSAYMEYLFPCTRLS